ncbi:hypothetical protein ACHAWX_004232, partial [Stephanocyclus meneghinianus]
KCHHNQTFLWPQLSQRQRDKEQTATKPPLDAIMAAAPHSHRSGKLKQQNKKNKRSTASKRSLNRRAGGKIQKRPGASGTAVGGGKAKADRINEARQRRELKKKELLASRRGVSVVGGEFAKVADGSSRPRIVGIISLSEEEEGIEERVREILIENADRIVTCSSHSREDGMKSSVTVHYDANKKSSPTSGNLTLLTNFSSFRSQYTQQGHSNYYAEQDASIQSALDLCRVCDIVLFVIDGRSVVNSNGLDHTNNTDSAKGGPMSIAATSIKTSANTAHLDHVISERGDRILTAVKSQGLPTPLTLIAHGEGDKKSSFGDVVIMDAENEDTMNNNDDGQDKEEYDCVMSVDLDRSTSHHTSRSGKSIQKTYLRRRAELKRYATRLACTEFGENGCKVMEIDLSAKYDDDAVVASQKRAGSSSNTFASSSTTLVTSKLQQTSISALVRVLCTISASGPTWVSDAPRPYLITDGTANSSSTLSSGGETVGVGPPAVVYNADNRELKLTGYIYGNTAPWNVNHLAHVPHLGTFAVKNVVLAGIGIESFPPIIAAERKSRAVKGNVEMKDVATNGEGVVLAISDPGERESLDMFASPDALEGEQNLIGFDDDADEFHGEFDQDGVNCRSGETDNFQPGTARPAGWSDYQSAWLDALDENEDVEDHGELAFALNKKRSDATTVGGNDVLMDDLEVNAEDRRALLAQRKKDRQDDLEFPDEVAVEEEGAARDRYARYRSLKSFRKSHWDPKENLPETYGAVYHFASFKATQKDVMADMKDLNEVVSKRGFGCNLIGGASIGADGDERMDSDEENEEAIARACVPSGAYVSITLEGVSLDAYSRVSPDAILTVVSLLPHENKVSVLHAGLSETSKCEADKELPIKSKDVLTFRCGWKTWQGRPIFSQNNLNSDKHKFERFMPQDGAFFACTMFGPVTYTPCPVLVFREAADFGEGKRRELLAHGSIIGADADRIVLKRIILTGYPTRVHKRHATVKYMFYNPEDVKVSV